MILTDSETGILLDTLLGPYVPAMPQSAAKNILEEMAVTDTLNLEKEIEKMLDRAFAQGRLDTLLHMIDQNNQRTVNNDKEKKHVR